MNFQTNQTKKYAIIKKIAKFSNTIPQPTKHTHNTKNPKKKRQKSARARNTYVQEKKRVSGQWLRCAPPRHGGAPVQTRSDQLLGGVRGGRRRQTNAHAERDAGRTTAPPGVGACAEVHVCAGVCSAF